MWPAAVFGSRRRAQRVPRLGGRVYDSNVFRTEFNPISDSRRFTITPKVGLRQNEGRLQYNASNYTGVLGDVPQEAGRRSHHGFRPHRRRPHLLRPGTARPVSPVSDRFRRLQNLNSTSDRTRSTRNVDTALLNDRFAVTINTARLGFEHRFSRRVSGTLAFAYDIFNSERPDAINSHQLLRCRRRELQALTRRTADRCRRPERHRYQNFDETIGQPHGGTPRSSASTAAGVRSTSVTARRFVIQGGPAFITSKEQAQIRPGHATDDTIPFYQRPARAAAPVSSRVPTIRPRPSAGARPVPRLARGVPRAVMHDELSYLFIQHDDGLGTIRWTTTDQIPNPGLWRSIRAQTIRLVDLGGNRDATRRSSVWPWIRRTWFANLEILDRLHAAPEGTAFGA